MNEHPKLNFWDNIYINGPVVILRLIASSIYAAIITGGLYLFTLLLGPTTLPVVGLLAIIFVMHVEDMYDHFQKEEKKRVNDTNG